MVYYKVVVKYKYLIIHMCKTFLNADLKKAVMLI